MARDDKDKRESTPNADDVSHTSAGMETDRGVDKMIDRVTRETSRHKVDSPGRERERAHSHVEDTDNKGSETNGRFSRREPERARDTHPIARFFDEDFLADPFDMLRFPERMFQLPHSMRRVMPRVDVSQTDTDIRVVVDLPGIDPDQIDIQIENDTLLLRGSINREEVRAHERPFRYERVTGSFKRRILLPSPVRPEEVIARYKDGVLTISLPRDDHRNKVKIERE